MKVVQLEPSKRKQGRWLVGLEDGSLVRVTESEVVAFGLYGGMELSEATRAALEEQAARSGLRGKALDLLTARPMSRRELVRKLTRRPRGREKSPPATEAQANETADWLEELGYLNDAEYAKTVARHYGAKGYGEHKLRDELFRRGVPQELWEAALAEAEDPAEGIDAFLRRRFRGEAPGPKELKRAADALARRGYRWEDIREGLNRCGAEIEEE